MPTKTWTEGGSPALTLNTTFTGGSGDFGAAGTTWNGSGNVNHDTGNISMTTDVGLFGPSLGVYVDLVDDGLIPAGAVLSTLNITFNYAITNGPMAGGTASSAINSDTNPSDVTQGVGTVSGTYNETGNALAVLGSTNPADLFTRPFGLSYVCIRTGTFNTHTRRLAVTGFAFTATYTVPTVTRVVPSIGPTAGGKLVSIYGTNFTGTPSVTFGGNAATGVVLVSATKLKCRTPAHAAGQVNVVVDGLTLTNGFRYRDTLFDTLSIRMAQQITVDDALNDAPNQAAFTVGKTGDPDLGASVNITDPASGAVLFGGSALVITAGIDAKPGHEHRGVTCGDFAWRLNALRPHGTWIDISATDVVQDLFDTFAPLFTPDIEAALPAVSVTFNRSKSFTECLSEIVGLFGGAWSPDDDFGVKVFTENTDDPPDDVTDSTPLYLPPPTVAEDLTQVRTRIYIKGAGDADSYESPADVGTGNPFSLAGGQVTPTAGGSIPQGSNDYDYGMSFVTAAGETVPLRTGPFGGLSDGGAINSFTLTSLDQYCSSDPRVTARNLYRTKSVDLVGGIERERLWLVATLNNTVGGGDDTYLDTKADADLTQLAPETDTTGTIFTMVEDAVAQAALAARFADGDDGIREAFINDSSLTTLAMATARGNAELALFAYPITTVTYACRDPKSKSGKEVDITLTSPAVSGTFRIQKVSIDQVAIDGQALQLFPRYTVVASSVRFSLEDLLRRLASPRALGRAG